jgi:tripartite-type tricarboxylate transporter receptor subunit TctC
LPEYPGLPTYAEQGFPDLVATIWFSLSAPANLPAEIADRLNAGVRRVLELPDVRQRLRPEGIEPGRLDAREFTNFVQMEMKRWAPVVRASGAKND